MNQTALDIRPLVTRWVVLSISLTFFTSPVDAFCIKDSETCVEGAETRLINGYNITRDCWRFASQYTCEGLTAVPDTHCQALIEQGCSPLSQTCDNDSCIQTYECAVATSATQQGEGCEDQSVAVDGLLYDTGYQPNNDLGLAASNMAALESAVTGMITNDLSCAEQPPGSGVIVCAEPIQIFSGQNLACRKDSVGFNKCCNLGGWGVDAGLNVCNAQEEALGYARQAGRTVYIGSYCTHENIFGCYAHAYVYCAFTSKIGRMIQQQGRPQLGIGWGNSRRPNCRGLSDTELSSINFELINFDEYFADAFAEMTNPPGSAQMQSIIDSYINKLQAADCSQFEVGCVNGLP